MFKNSEAFSSFSVDDIAAAKQFYGDTLGVAVREQPEGLGLEIAGGGKVFLYPKEDHAPATFTVLNFQVDDVDATVAALKAKGVRFEHYDDEHLKTDSEGIARGPHGPTIAWFKDPAGNILSVLKPE
jgi:catechol 2,3-dioxygenase-like lactoylglutathione lyase family enzyme